MSHITVQLFHVEAIIVRALILVIIVQKHQRKIMAAYPFDLTRPRTTTKHVQFDVLIKRNLNTFPCLVLLYIVLHFINCEKVSRDVSILNTVTINMFSIIISESSSSKNAPGNLRLPGAFFDELD